MKQFLQKRPQISLIVGAYVSVALATFLFAHWVVGYVGWGPKSGTSMWDIAFAWQFVILMALAVAYILMAAHRKAFVFLVKAFLLFVAVAVPFLLAFQTYVSGNYIKQGLKPAGATLHCLAWRHELNSQGPNSSLDTFVCTATNAVQLNSVYFGNDETVSSPRGYWASLVIWQIWVSAWLLGSIVVNGLSRSKNPNADISDD